ncbi:MAG: Tm-1-like ATP-binding domain-containing protein [Chloroflexota bacterium]
MPAGKVVVLIGTLDTKGEELAFVKGLVEARGHRVLVVDIGVLGQPAFAADVSREEVAAAAGADLAELARMAERGRALTVMMNGAALLACELRARGELDGILGLGGGSGSAVASGAMRALPFGVPKLLVTTKGSDDVGPYVGTKDIAVLHSVTDIMGLNPILRRVLANAAGAISGMVETEAVESRPRPTVAISAFGVTTPAALRCRDLLSERGYEALVFHANGTGGRAMEDLMEQGAVDAVLDLTTTELADELCGGTQSAGSTRLLMAGRLGLPQVVAPGAMDMVNFFRPESLPPEYAARLLYRHSPTTVLMRTSMAENAVLGRWLGERLSTSRGPAALLLPRRGFSEYGKEGGVFHDPAADLALIAAARAAAGERVEVLELDTDINDPAFAEAAVDTLLRLIAAARGERQEEAQDGA